MANRSEFLSELVRRTPTLALAVLAARQGGMPALGAFQGGMLERQQYEDARTRQDALDDERRQAQAAQEARAASAEQRAIEAARRAEEDQRIQRFQGGTLNLREFGTQLADTAADPIAAENAMLGRASALESVFNIPPGQLSPFISNMAPIVTRGIRSDARQLLADAETQAKKIPGSVVDDSAISFDWKLATPRLRTHFRQAGHPEGQPFKPSQLREIAGSITVAAPAATGLTYGEIFPAARNTPQGAVVVPMKENRIDLNEATLTATRMGWISDRTSERQIREAAITALRDRLRFVMRNPGAAGATTIARQMRGYGLDPQVEIDKAAREIEGQNISRARALEDMDPNAQFGTAEALRRGFEFASDPAARGAALENVRRALPGPVGTRQPVPNAVYDFVPGKGLVPAAR